MEPKKAKRVAFADDIGASDQGSTANGNPTSSSRRLMAQNAAGEVQLNEGIDLMSKSKTNVANFHLAIYIGMAHAGLVLALLMFYGVGLLLKDYWKPIQWAVLISMPLREVQGVVVQFWEPSLQLGLVETLLAIPVAVLHALMETGHDLRGAYLTISGTGLALPPKSVTFFKLFQWLLSFGICTLAYEFLGLVLFLAALLVSCASVWFMTCLLPLFTGAFPMRSPRAGERRSSAARLLEWTVTPIVRATRWSNRGVTQSIIKNLPTLVALVLIVSMIMLVLGGVVLFTYKVGVEAKDAVITLKSHVQLSQSGTGLRISQWLEENNMNQYIDSHMTIAYDTLIQKVDAIAAKNNMTEVAKIAKEFLNGIAHKGTVIGIGDASPSRETISSGNSFVHFFRHIKDKFHLGEVYNLAKKLLVSGGNFMTGGFYVFIILGTTVFNFITQAFVFFSVLYFLITSESGGVMYQAMDMVPLSDVTRRRCATVLDHTVSAILLATTKTMFFQALFTYLFLRFFKIHFLYMSTLIALVQGLIPLFPKWTASVPAILQLLLERRYLEGVILVALYKYIMDYGFSKIQGNPSNDNQYLTGLSIAGGMTLFTPAISGVIMGPLLMTVLIAARNLYSEFVLKVHAEYQDN